MTGRCGVLVSLHPGAASSLASRRPWPAPFVAGLFVSCRRACLPGGSGIGGYVIWRVADHRRVGGFGDFGVPSGLFITTIFPTPLME